MIPSWRSPVLLALLSLIALILVLPQVGLPDYLSSDVAFKVATPTLLHSPANAGLNVILSAGRFANSVVTPALPIVSPPLPLPLIQASPELRC
jgi:hypothetical protein